MGGGVNRQELARYDLEALVHVYAYRALVIYSLAYFVILLLGLTSSIPYYVVKAATVVMWAISTPSFYELVKGFALVRTRGLAFGHLPESFREVLARRVGMLPVYRALPGAAMVIWAAGLVVYLVMG